MFNPAHLALLALLAALPATAMAQAGAPPAGDKSGQGGVKPADGTDTVPVRAIPQGSWFEKIQIKFGGFHEKAGSRHLDGIYGFENKTDKDWKITAVVPSCKCQKLKLMLGAKEVPLKNKDDVSQMLKEPIVVPAGSKGRLFMQFDISGGPGPRVGDVRVDTTDPAMPSLTLTCEANIIAAYDVQPAVVNLGQMGPKEQRQWSCMVRCIVRKEWEVTKPAPPLPNGLAVTSMERKTDETGISYLIKGTYGPGLEEGAMGGIVVFLTDDKSQNFQLEVRAEVREKVKLSPRFFSFSNFPRNKSQERTVHLWPTAAKGDLEIERVEIGQCSVPREFLEVQVVAPPKLANGAPPNMITLKGLPEPIAAHRLWKLVVRLKPNIPKRVRVVRGAMKVFLKGEGFVPKPFGFNGFIRNAR